MWITNKIQKNMWGRIERMMIACSKRRLTRELYKFITKMDYSEKNKEILDSNIGRWVENHSKGAPKDDFIDYIEDTYNKSLVAKECDLGPLDKVDWFLFYFFHISFFTRVMRLRVSIRTTLLDSCIEDGLIKEVEGKYLKVGPYAKVTWWEYWVSVPFGKINSFVHNQYVFWFVTVILWSIAIQYHENIALLVSDTWNCFLLDKC